MDDFKFELPKEGQDFKRTIEEIPTGTWNFKIVAAYSGTSKNNKDYYKMELLAIDSDSPIYGRNVHKMNFLTTSTGKSILMSELHACGINTDLWVRDGMVSGAEFAAQLEKVGEKLLNKQVKGMKTKRFNQQTNSDWHEIRLIGLSEMVDPNAGEAELPF